MNFKKSLQLIGFGNTDSENYIFLYNILRQLSIKVHFWLYKTNKKSIFYTKPYKNCLTHEN